MKEHREEILVGIPKGTLIDFETTGLDERKDEIITLGYIRETEIVILQREDDDRSRFYDKLREHLENISYPAYAYNSGFEERFAREQLGINIEAKNVEKPWKN